MLRRGISAAALVAAFAAGSAATVIGHNSSSRELVLQPGDWIVMPGINLQCHYVKPFTSHPWLQLDCGRGYGKNLPGEMEGIRVITGTRWVDIYRWSEGEQWKRLARVQRRT